MSATVKKINHWFQNATRADLNNLLSKIILSERQNKVFDMFYIENHDIGFIADTLFISTSVINVELRVIRNKIDKVI